MSERLEENFIGRVFTSALNVEQIVQLREKLDAMSSGTLRDKAEAAWVAKDYALAAAWEADSHKPDYAQPTL